MPISRESPPKGKWEFRPQNGYWQRLSNSVICHWPGLTDEWWSVGSKFQCIKGKDYIQCFLFCFVLFCFFLCSKMWIETNSGWFQSPGSQREAKTTFISPNYQLRLERRHWRHGLAPFHLWGRDLGTKLRGRVWATRVGRAPGPLTLLLLLFSHYVQFFATPWTTVCQAFLSFTIF